MATVVKSFAIQGIEGYNVDIETKILDGQPMISIIGMGDTAVKESADRIQSAIDESGYVFPKKRVIISLAPGDMKKKGSHYDLAMVIGVLQEDDNIASKELNQYAFIGELCLDGGLRTCCGILPMILAAKKSGIKKIIIPEANMEEANLVKGIEIYGFSKLIDVIHFLEGKQKFEDKIMKPCANAQHIDTIFDFKDVKGQKEIIEASLLAAAGGHNMLMIGEPGCGKTMIAQRIPTILPLMTEEECLEVTKIYSIFGLLPVGHSLIRNRPFRAPHHNASLNSQIGGGVNAMPGEVSLAHNGVLFLDELAEFSRKTLDALRQPIEDKKFLSQEYIPTHKRTVEFKNSFFIQILTINIVLQKAETEPIISIGILLSTIAIHYLKGECSMEAAIRDDYKIMFENQQTDIRNMVLAGLEQIKQGKTQDLKDVCDRLEKKYSDAEV